MSALAPFRLTCSMKSRPFVIAATLLTVVATFLPDQTLPFRLATPFLGLIVVVAPYLFFRLYLGFITRTGRSWSYYYTALIYYMGITGAVLSYLMLPYQWTHSTSNELPRVLLLMSGLGGLAAAIAATEVAHDNEWGLTNRWSGRDT